MAGRESFALRSYSSRFFSQTSCIQRQAVELQSLLRGEGRERVCRAIKVTNPSAPAHPAYIQPIIIHDQDDDFPDGNYELMVGEQIFRFVKRNGEYISVP
jgi:hypothetical protein